MSDLALPAVHAGSLTRHAGLGIACIVLGLGGLGYWAGVTPIAGAVIAGGTVVVDGGSRRVQHQEGGIVKEILVANEDRVTAGDVLLRLDDTAISANLAVIHSQLIDAYIRRARLLAESTAAETMAWPAALDALPDPAQSRMLFEAEDLLRRTRARGLANQAAQLDEQVTQLSRLIEGLTAEGDAVAREIAIVRPEADRIATLFAQGLVEGARVASIERDLTQLEGSLARTDAEIARARATVAERTLQISQLDDTFRGEVLAELQKVNQTIAELTQQKIAAEDRLARLDIRAPVGGIVHESLVRTVGGVVGSGETLMQIVPQDETMMVDVRVSPLDIDKLLPGQEVTLRFSSFDPTVTPELSAGVTRISPDLSTDPVSGAQFYLVRVGVPETELAELPASVSLVPGMPVEAFLKTGERTVASYLLKPFTERIATVFRED